MVQIGYTMMCEQRGPTSLVADVVAAERAGFDFSVISDHFHPWVQAQGHSSFAWSVLGAAAQATSRISLMTCVTTPTMRYHPAIIAQAAATVALLSNGRFRLGLGAGERLNEHIVGLDYPAVDGRHAKLREAVDGIRQLFSGGFVTYRGEHVQIESARLFDLPASPPEIGIAVSGKESCRIAGELADLMIATEPKAELVRHFQAAGGSGKPIVGQLPICWGQDETACRRLAHEQFSWSLGGWKLQSELPNTANFEAFGSVVSEEQVAQSIPCGPDIDRIVTSVKAFADAGFTEIALVQIGPEQGAFCDFFERELGARLRAL